MKGKPFTHTPAETIIAAAEIIRHDGVVALPTETFFALAVNPFSPPALKKLFALKQRSLAKPVLLLISNLGQLNRLVEQVPTIYNPLIRSFWPGPLTLIFRARRELPALVTGGTQTVGIRLSSSATVQQLCSVLHGPITGTSANISGGLPATDGNHIREIFGQRIDLVLETSQAPTATTASTVVEGLNGALQVIRAGAISEDILL